MCKVENIIIFSIFSHYWLHPTLLEKIKKNTREVDLKRSGYFPPSICCFHPTLDVVVHVSLELILLTQLDILFIIHLKNDRMFIFIIINEISIKFSINLKYHFVTLNEISNKISISRKTNY